VPCALHTLFSNLLSLIIQGLLFQKKDHYNRFKLATLREVVLFWRPPGDSGFAFSFAPCALCLAPFILDHMLDILAKIIYIYPNFEKLIQLEAISEESHHKFLSLIRAFVYFTVFYILFFILKD